MEDIIVNLLTFAAGWVLKQPRPLAKSILGVFKKRK
jgi:hypothetical protein